jgi:hypothetical protein
VPPQPFKTKLTSLGQRGTLIGHRRYLVEWDSVVDQNRSLPQVSERVQEILVSLFEGVQPIEEHDIEACTLLQLLEELVGGLLEEPDALGKS